MTNLEIALTVLVVLYQSMLYGLLYINKKQNDTNKWAIEKLLEQLKGGAT